MKNVEHIKVNLYDTSCHLLWIPVERISKFMVYPHRYTVSESASRMGADIAVNGDGWGLPSVLSGRPNSLAYTNGICYQHKQFDLRPWFNINKDGKPSIGWKRPPDPYNLVSGDRYLMSDGMINLMLRLRLQEKDARTAIGINAEKDTILLLVADGNNKAGCGLTWLEMAALFKNNLNAHDAINLDGGGSTALWYHGNIVNTPNDDGVLGERAVINQLLFWMC